MGPRLDKIKRDYLSMKELREKSSFVNFITDNDGDVLNYYIIELSIQSIVGNRPDRNGQLVLKSPFRFRVVYSNEPPFKTDFILEPNSNPLFHPYIAKVKYKLSGKLGHVWIDTKEYDPEELLAEVVIRLAKSLQYFPGYINETFSNKGNKAAFDWFINQKQVNPSFFPVDNREIIDLHSQLPTETKKFTISRQTELPKKRFAVKAKSEGFEITRAAMPSPTIIPPFSSTRNRYDDNQLLYILPTAREKIFAHIRWGEIADANQMEQGGILLGNVFADESGTTFAVIEDAISAEHTTSNSIHLSMTHETWIEMLHKADELKQQREGLYLVGWYHTHPGQLDVFMSDTDVETQRRLFSNKWNFAAVLNPHKLLWRVFYGVDARECKGYFTEHFAIDHLLLERE